MSIIKKLSQARLMLANRPLKKSGINKFAGFHYFELADFLPAVVEIFAELEMVDTIQIDSHSAILTLHSEGETLEFACAVPGSIPDLKGQNPLQVVGSMQTYLRRYLYVTALGIVENDVIDSVEQKEPQAPAVIDGDQYSQLSAYCLDDGKWTAIGEKLSKAYRISGLGSLPASKFTEALSRCEQAAKQVKP